MEEHHQWVNATSCHPHTGSPYSQEEFDDCVSISAIMENFDTDKLVEFVNHVCKTTQQSWLTHHLEASPMQSGIQFQPTCENFTYAIKLESGSTARLYSNYYFDSRGTEESFFKNCKIQITNREVPPQPKQSSSQHAATSRCASCWKFYKHFGQPEAKHKAYLMVPPSVVPRADKDI